ncbi:retrovirus-related pol polyprotein from transposon TNT 1-94 [Tanacetum coccineum]
MAVPISTREPKHNVKQSVATSSKKTVTTDSTVKKSRNITRKLYEQVSKTCSWWYPKYTPPRYNWKPKSQIGNVNPNVSMPLGNASRTANFLKHKTPRCSTVSNTPLSSNSFAAHRDNSIHRRLWGNDLLTGSRGTDLYSITLQNSTTPNLICLMAKATSSQAWLWHRRLSHLNFDTMDLCGPMRVESINGKKYVLVASDDLRDALSVIFGLSELKEGLHYSIHHPTSSIPYPRFTKIIISHYMTNFPKISRRVRDRRSIRLTPPALVPTVDKADGMILQDTLQVTLAEYKSREEQEARENVERNNALSSDPRSDFFKESPEVKITNNEEVEITNVVIPINVNEEEEEITDEVYELKQREKGKIVEESRNTPFPTPIRSLRIHIDLVSSDTEKLQELTVTDTTPTPSSSSLNTKLSTTNRLLSLFKAKPARFKCYKSFFQELQGRYGYLFEHLRAKFLSRKSFDTLVDHLQEVTVESLPTMVDNHIKEQVKKQVPEEVKVQERGKLQAKISSQIQQAIDINIPSLVDASDDPHDDAHPEGENSAKRPKTSKYEAHVTGESSRQVNEKEQDDDEILTKQVSQDIIEEVSLTINEAELKKIADEMLRQRCTSGDEHQYHIDQIKNFLKSDIVWERKKEILASPHPRKTTPLV